MKERSDKVSWSAYEEEGKKLMAEALKKRDAVLEKYRNIPHMPGLDGDPSAKELREVTKWFGEEAVKLKRKCNFEPMQQEMEGSQTNTQEDSVPKEEIGKHCRMKKFSDLIKIK